MKSRFKVLSGIIALAMVWILTFSICTFAAEDTTFVMGTYINGVSVGRLTTEEAARKLADHYAAGYELSLVKKDGTSEVIRGTEIGYQAVVQEGLSELLQKQNEEGRVSGPGIQLDYTVGVHASFDETALTAKIQALECVSGSSVKKTENARISSYEEGKPFTIVPEVQGDSLNVEILTAAVKQALSSGQKTLNLMESGCYESVAVTKEDAHLKDLLQVMNQCRDMVITYEFGDGVKEELTGQVLVTWLTGTTEDGLIGVDRDKAAAYIKTLADQYDTADTMRVFHTTSGKDVELTGSYGWKLDQAAETDAVIGMIRTGQTQTREIQYTKKAASRAGSDWGNTYVEIDLGGQHVYLYQEGQLVWDAPCVTGNVSKNHTTPSGIYSLAYKETDRILRGQKQKDGTYEYESHVDYWMPFHGGIGLHDAKWRSSFGGQIYLKNGSHGCINLPPAKVKDLYDRVYKGIPVICHE